MTNTPPPANYQWDGNTLSYSLDPTVVGLMIKYKKEGQTNWIVLFEDSNSAPTSLTLSSSEGPNITVYGVTGKGKSEEWGPPSEETITNQPT